MRAVYEGIGYNLRWIMENYEADYGFVCDNFRIIGGGALDDCWMQMIADITGKSFDVVRDPRNSGAVGAAIVALIGLGELPDFRAAKDFVQIERHYAPDPGNKEIYDELFDSYKDIYNSLNDVYIKANGKRFKGEAKENTGILKRPSKGAKNG